MTVGEVPKLPGGSRADLVAELHRQAGGCRPTSLLYAALLDACADDAAAGGPVAGLLDPYADDPLATVPSLRLLAAVHRLVLTGRAPDLAAFYPSVGGDAPPERAWPAFRAVLVRHAGEIAPWLAAPVQTNEPGRSAVLYGGLLVVAHRSGLPVRLLEIGASAGLNLRADRFAYRVGDRTVGDPGSPVVFDQPWRGEPPAPVDTTVTVAERAGCDLAPIDPLSADGRLRLLSLVWPDAARIARLRAALEVAARVPASLDAAPADRWLAARLTARTPGRATVVWHSIVRQYVDPTVWARVGTVLDAAGGAATPDAPLAHLAYEPDVDADGGFTFTARLTLWPGSRTERLAVGHGHGPPVRWTPEDAGDRSTGGTLDE